MSEVRPKACAQCAKPITLHLTKVIDGKVWKVGLCSACPEAVALKSSVGFDLIEGASGAAVKELSPGDNLACPNCGLRPEDFKESGRLGCGQCYEVFADRLETLLGKLHSGAEHLGKTPRGRRREVSPEKIAALKRRLDEHVSREEYELAAVVRDQLKALES